MHYLIGFLIALAVGLTGIGGGSFTVPALVLLAGLTAGEAVGTAFLFAGVLRLIAAPFYLAGRHIHARYLWLLLQGAVPGLLVGIWLLRLLSRDRGKPSGDPNPGCHPGGVILRDLYPSRAKSLVRREEPSLASLAGSAHRSGVGIFIRGRWSAWNGSAVELFRNDPGASRGNGFALWIGAGGDRQRFPLEFWLDQHPDTFRASARWRSGSGRWLLAGAESSCQQAEDGGCHGRDLCRIAIGLDRKPYTR